jgi:hypothetical protein
MSKSIKEIEKKHSDKKKTNSANEGKNLEEMRENGIAKKAKKDRETRKSVNDVIDDKAERNSEAAIEEAEQL